VLPTLVDAKEEKGKDRGKIKKMKTRKHKEVFLCPNQGPSSYLCVCVTSKLQGLSLVWVQFPKELHMKKGKKTSKLPSKLLQQTKIRE
jgi:hypothetical protein